MGFADNNDINIHNNNEETSDDNDIIQNDKNTLKPNDDQNDHKHNLEEDNDGDWVLNPGVTLMGNAHDTNNEDEKLVIEGDINTAAICSDTDDNDGEMEFKQNLMMGFAEENEKISYNEAVDDNHALSVKWLLSCMQHNALFVNNLNKLQREHIVNAMNKKYVRLNETVIEQHANNMLEEDNFYIIESGRYAAYIDDVRVRSWSEKGNIFGELSLFNNTQRAATIKCTHSGFLWCLDRNTFKYICDKYNKDDTEILSQYKDKAKVLWLFECIQQNDLFKNLNWMTKKNIVQQMKLIQPECNENIIVQHSVSPLTVYVVEEGEYFAIIDGMRVTSWIKGGIFGELALLYDKPRSATIQCVSEDSNKLWMLNRNKFRNICDEYKHYNEEEKYNDALYREYICNKNIKCMQLSRKTRSYSQDIQLIAAKKEIQSKADEISAYIDKYYMELFVDNAIVNVIEGDVICSGDAMNCNCFKRVGYLLSIYNNDINDDDCSASDEGVNFYQILNETLGEYYNTSVLCDDFYHILSTHCNGTDFEILYDMMTHIFLRNKACDANKCVMMRRNNRIRSGDTFDIHHTQQIYGANIMNDAQQITTKQLLDKLHCFFIHSFDCGHRTFYKHDNDAADKISTIRTRARGNKFVLNLEESPNENMNDVIYSFGYKYLYWDKLQNDDGFIITKKYDSLKAELLQNDISCIDEASWIELLIISDTFHKTNHVKKIYKADFNNRGIKRNAIMTQSHLISILMYCNFDLFQRKFTETFRKQTAHENMQSVIQRHCNFYWMGRLLYESVNIYGKRVVDYECKTFYHGINQQMYFTSPKSQIHGPLSTTNELSVAQSFDAGENGLIVVLEADEYGHNKYFDMAFISDFCSESEFFFIGGLLPMTFINIININKGFNYETYIKNFSILFNIIMNGVKYKFDDDETKLQIIHLIQCKLNNTLYIKDDDDNDYIFKLFDRYCVQRTAISINYPYFESQFKDIFFNKNDADYDDIIQLNVFLKLFLNLEYLKMDYVLLSHDLFESILNILSAMHSNVAHIDDNVVIYQKEVYLNNKLMMRKKLNRIQLNYPSIASKQTKIEQYITKYTPMFNKLQWSINYDYLVNKMFIQKLPSIL